MALTHREARYVRARIEGKSERKALLAAGFSPGLAKNPSYVVTDEMREEVERLQAALVENTLEHALIDATELHEYLTDAIRADLADILDDDHNYKPLSEWPLIWRQMYEGGDLEVEFASERSHDGEDKDGAGGWDHVGKIVKVKYRFASRRAMIELAMKHKGVDAMIQPGSTTINNNNLMVVTAEKAREVMAAKKRLQIAEARENAQDLGETRTESSDDGAV